MDEPVVERPQMTEYGVPEDLEGVLRGAGSFVRVVPRRAFGVIERADEFAPRATRWRWEP